MTEEKNSFNKISLHSYAGQQYYQLPKLLVHGKKYKDILKPDDILAYALLYDRLRLSQKNNWVDKEGYCYLVYTTTQLMEALNVRSRTTLSTIKKRLKQVELLEEAKTGRTSRIYLAYPEAANEEDAKYIIELTNLPKEDLSTWSEEERRNKSIQMENNDHAIKYKNEKIEAENCPENQDKNFQKNKRCPKIEHRLFNPSNTTFTEVIHRNEKQALSKNWTSDVQKMDTSNNELVIDKSLDQSLDQGDSQNFNKKNKNKLGEILDENSPEMIQQYLRDLHDQFHPQIISALSFLSDYENIYELSNTIQRAYMDLVKGKFSVAKDLDNGSKETIQGLLASKYDLVAHDDFAWAIHDSLLRSARYIYGNRMKRSIQNHEAYYYHNLQQAMVDYAIKGVNFSANKIDSV
ncbi:replication initiator protein A [Hutsoniella sourekii]|uniref:replication initiator protein A n=1 Tax=Hutsoniella sourekii TaxID=87650 RepID=UPI000489980E|nr:replication initiator protein A [Hutsoniella sourekii]